MHLTMCNQLVSESFGSSNGFRVSPASLSLCLSACALHTGEKRSCLCGGCQHLAVSGLGVQGWDLRQVVVKYDIC
jgi:hypothetical protein